MIKVWNYINWSILWVYLYGKLEILLNQPIDVKQSLIDIPFKNLKNIWFQPTISFQIF